MTIKELKDMIKDYGIPDTAIIRVDGFPKNIDIAGSYYNQIGEILYLSSLK